MTSGRFLTFLLGITILYLNILISQLESHLIKDSHTKRGIDVPIFYEKKFGATSPSHSSLIWVTPRMYALFVTWSSV